MTDTWQDRAILDICLGHRTVDQVEPHYREHMEKDGLLVVDDEPWEEQGRKILWELVWELMRKGLKGG